MADPMARATIAAEALMRIRERFIAAGWLLPDPKESTMPDPTPLTLEQLVADVREAEAMREGAQAEHGEVLAALLGLDAGLVHIEHTLRAELRVTEGIGEAIGVAVGLRHTVRALRRTLDEPNA